MSTRAVDVFGSDDLVKLFHDEPALLAVADAIAMTQAGRSSRARLSRRHVAAGLVAAAALAAVAALLVGVRGSAVSSASAATSVTTLRAFTSPAPAVSEKLLPSSVRMFLAHISARLGEPLGQVQQPVSGTPSIFLVTLGHSDLCLVMVIHGATASCHDELRQGDGSVGVDVDIVDGKLFVTGLAANDVTAITATEAGASAADTHYAKANLVSNTFYAALPYSGGGTGAITLVVERSDQPDVTVDVPGVPAPTAGH